MKKLTDKLPEDEMMRKIIIEIRKLKATMTKMQRTLALQTLDNLFSLGDEIQDDFEDNNHKPNPSK